MVKFYKLYYMFCTLKYIYIYFSDLFYIFKDYLQKIIYVMICKLKLIMQYDNIFLNITNNFIIILISVFCVLDND